MNRRSLDALQRAVRLVGTQTELAKRLSKQLKRDVRQGHVWSWLNRDMKVPHWAARAIEAVSGVSRHELRPDLYPRDER